MALAIRLALQAQQAVIAALGPEAVALAIAVLGTRRRTLGGHGEGTFADHHRGRILAIEGRAHAQITTLVRGLAAGTGAGAGSRFGAAGGAASLPPAAGGWAGWHAASTNPRRLPTDWELHAWLDSLSTLQNLDPTTCR
jgi:hypothetical protein